MSKLLVLQRDRKTGELKMSVEINPTPPPAWTPGPAPWPNTQRDPAPPLDDDDVDWVTDAVCGYVRDIDLSPLEVSRVHWRALRDDVDAYVRESR